MAGEAIDAIKIIGSTISEVIEEVAIGAAVPEQGAATQKITRSTPYAAQGTRNVSESNHRRQNRCRRSRGREDEARLRDAEDREQACVLGRIREA